MTHKLDGGPAYPMPASEGYHSQQSGMTLRDWFAGQALANPRTYPEDDSCVLDIATWAYGLADAMVKERDVE